MKRAAFLATSLLLLALLLATAPAGVLAESTQLYDGDARYFDDPPDLIAYANTTHSTPPTGVNITDGGGLWRYNEWIGLMQQGDWIEATCTGTDTTSIGVQLWGDANDGWARILVDGTEVWTGDTYGPTATGYIKYLEVSSLTAGSHTVRVENMGVAGDGGGDDVAVYFFGCSSASSPTPPATGGSTFYAIYDRLVDLENGGVSVGLVALSGDGKKLAFTGVDAASSLVLYTVNADGSDLTKVALPDLGGRFFTSLAISRDGSRVFFSAGGFLPLGYTRIYKAEDGAATLILDTDNHAEVNECYQVKTTADGSYVYFQEYDDDLWRVSHVGGAPQLVVDAALVNRDGGTGAIVRGFDISADGSTVAFVLLGYYDTSWVLHSKYEVFVLDGGSFRQLTNDTGDVIKSGLAISGDGGTIVFSAATPQNKWYSIASDGNNKIALEDTGLNFGGVDLAYDGAQMFYDDDGANGGRLTNTGGSGRLDLFPEWNVYGGITLNVYRHASISDDGRRIAFNFQYSNSPYRQALYIGFLNDPDAVPDAPTIHNIAFDPPAMPRDDSTARVTLTSQVSDPQGLADIARTSTDELLDGVLTEGYTCPAYFNHSAHDDGASPDLTAGDGVFSTEGQPGDTIDSLDQVTVRMAARDASNTVVVADTILLIGGSGQMPILPPTDLQAEPGVDTVGLTWAPSTSPDLSGYNVYRSTDYAAASWPKINTALVTGDYYLDDDASLTAGTTYYYYLTAVDSASAESDPSNIASATFGELKLYIPDSYGDSGAEVTLPVNIANANGLEMCGVDIFVTYDQTVLTATDVEQTAMTAGYGWAENTTTPGIVRAVIATTQGETLYGEGTLFNVLFDVIGASGDTSDLEFQVTGTFFYDCDDLFNEVPLDLSDVGLFTVQGGFILGDLNGDGVVNSADAALALEIAVGNVIPTPEQETAGDVNGDGRINSADASLIMRLAAGLPLVPAARQLMAMTVTQPAAVGLSAPTNATVSQGGSTWVALAVDDAANLAGGDIVLNYDPFVATATDARATSLSASFDVEFNVPVAGQARISLKPKTGSEGGLASGSGALVEIKFTGSASAAADSTSTLNLASVRLNDQYGRDFATSAVQTGINVTHGLLTLDEGADHHVYLPLTVR